MTSPDPADVADPAPDVLQSAAAGGKVVRGGVVRVVGFGLSVLLGLGTSALLLRHLGVSEYGKYGTIAALLGLVLALSDGGLTAIGARDLATAETTRARASIASTLMFIRLVAASIGVLIAVAFAALAYRSGELTLGATLVGVSVIIISLQAMATIPLLVSLRVVPITLFDIVRHVLTFVGILALVLAEAGLEWFFALQIPIAAALLAGTVIYVRRSFPIAIRLHRSSALRLGRETLPMAIASTMIVLYGSTMVVIVSLIASEIQTGLFATSARIMEVVVALPGLVIAIALPVLSVASLTDRTRLRNALHLMLRLGMVLSMLMAVALCIAAPGVIGLIGGRSFSAAAPVLQVQAFAIVGVFISQTLISALISLRQQRVLIATNAVALTTVLVLGVAFVTQFGAVGGAYAILTAEAVFIVSLYATLRRRAPDVAPSLLFVWKPLLCAIAALGALLLPLQSSWLAAAAGIGLYLVVAVLLRAIPAELIVGLASPVWGEERVRAATARHYGME